MAYIGVQPAEAYTSFAVQHFTTSATTSYTLDNPVANENEIALFINNVRQQPGSSYAYTASGTALTLSAATSASDTMYCVFIGKAVQTVTPANNSVTGDMLSKPFTYDDASNGSVTGISVNNDYDTLLTASSGTGSGIRFGVNDGSFTSAFGDARGSEILSVTQQSNGRSRDIVFKTDNGGTLGEAMRIDSSSNLKFNSGYGSVATAYGCRAWVNFNGSGTVSIRGSGNVTSITDDGTGLYTINFTNAMPDTNYTVVMCNNTNNGGTETDRRFITNIANDTGGTLDDYEISTTSVTVERVFIQNGTTRGDSKIVSIGVFR